MNYCVDAPETVQTVRLDTLTAIYHRRSGQTHIVAEPMPEILAALAQGAADVPTMLQRLGLADTFVDALSARLEELVATGLVARR